MVGSDGLPNDPLPHPRLWGAFPRVLGHYARDTSLVPLEEAVRKMTGLSARRFGLSERGQVQVGYHADLVLFDADKVQDTATFAEPRQTADGIDAVWVNGARIRFCAMVTGTQERDKHFVGDGEVSRLTMRLRAFLILVEKKKKKGGGGKKKKLCLRVLK